MARLIPAKCPNCGAAVQVNPLTEWVTCSYCQTSSYVETPARRHAPNHPPAHMPVIRIPAAAPIAVFAILGAIMALSVLGALIAWLMASPAPSSASHPRPTRPVPTAVAPPVVTAAVPPKPQVDYFADATSIPAAYKARAGGRMMALEVLIYPTYSFLKVRDPNKPAHVDSYALRDGLVTGPDPHRLAGREKDNLEAHLFDLGAMNFKLVPRMVADAKARLGYENARASHIILGRKIPFGNDIAWRVYVSSDRESGRVEYDTAGRMTKIYK